MAFPEAAPKSGGPAAWSNLSADPGGLQVFGRRHT